MSRVFFDLGNTRVKWKLDSAAPAQGAFSYEEMWPQLRQLRGPSGGADWTAVVASVVKDSRYDAFVGALHSVGFNAVFRCVVTPFAVGVQCAYEDVSRLGIDRWLAVVAAWNLTQSPVVVVDLGTAATVDFVDESGVHLGGFILPGLRMGVHALLKGTSDVRVDVDKLSAGRFSPGRNTEEAVCHGAVFAMKALIESALARHLKRHSQSRLFITGGDSNLVASVLECHYQKNEDLVFAGMELLADAKLVIKDPAQEQI